MPTEGDEEWKAQAVQFLRAMNQGMGVPEDKVDEFTERSFVTDGHGRWSLRSSKVLLDGLRGDQHMFDAYRAVASPLLIVLSSKPPKGVPDAGLSLMEAYRRGLARAFDELAQQRPSVRVVNLPDVSHLSIASRHAPLVAETIQKFLHEVHYL